MTFQAKILCAVAVSAFAALAATSPAQALTAQECSAKYQAAKTAGTLGGQTWNDFRKAQCGADATAAPRAATRRSAGRPEGGGAKPKKEAGGAGRASGPGGVSVRDRSEICQGNRQQGADAYLRGAMEANKAANTTGGLRWIQKGGGYWSECNKKLKA